MLGACYTHKNILDQFSNSYHFPQRVLEFFKKTFPYIPDLKPYKNEDFYLMTSPFTPNQEDELFLGMTYGNLVQLISGNG